MNICTLLRANNQRSPDKSFIVHKGNSWSYQETLQITQGVASGLRQLGLKKGDRLGIFGYNSAEWVFIYLAASFAGLIVVPISTRAKGEELIHIFSHAQVNGIVFDASLEGYIGEVKDSLTTKPWFVSLNGQTPDWAVSFQHIVQSCGEFLFFDESGLTDGHSICFTSGTTGLPKGVLLTQANLVLGQHYNCLANFPFTGEDVFVITTPLCHRTGWGRLVQALGLGATACILPTPFEPEELIKVIIKCRATVVGMVPTMARMLLQQCTKTDLEGLESWQALLLTGESCPQDLKKEFREKLPQVDLYTFYASTETGMISCLYPEDQLTKGASVGNIVMGLEVQLDPEGEILVRSGKPGQFAVMAEYCNDPDSTAMVLNNGWYHTGDVGKYDEDGILYIVDRKKDLIITGGLNVSSKEVEEVLCRHPLIREAAVVSTPDQLWGEAIRAFLVVEGAITKEEIISFCTKNLTSYKKPKIIEFVDELPRNSNGKVLIHDLKNRPFQDELNKNCG